MASLVILGVLFRSDVISITESTILLKSRFAAPLNLSFSKDVCYHIETPDPGNKVDDVIPFFFKTPLGLSSFCKIVWLKANELRLRCCFKGIILCYY